MRKIISSLLLLLVSVGVHAEVFNQKFDSNGHPKAKGAWVTVRYPQGWEAKEGERPNIVKKFSGDYKGYFTTLSLQIKKGDGSVEGECRETSAQDFVQILAEGDSSIKFAKVRKIQHESKPAFIFDINQPIQRAGMTVSASNRVMAVCSKDKLIMLWCANMRLDSRTNTITSSLEELNVIEPVCYQFFNSLVLMDNY